MTLDLDDEGRRWGFELARQLPAVAFRQHLRSLGWTASLPIIPAVRSERVVDMVARIEDGLDALVVLPDGALPHGVRVFAVEFIPQAEACSIDLGTTMASLLEALPELGVTIPSQSGRALRFRPVLPGGSL